MFLLAVEEATESLARPPVRKAWQRMGFESRQYAAMVDFECLHLLLRSHVAPIPIA